MSAFDHIFMDTKRGYFQLLKGKASAKARMQVVRTIMRPHAIALLADAVRRIPTDTPSRTELRKAKGLSVGWNLNDDDTAVVFCLRVPSANPTPAEQHGADLLRACVYAAEVGDVDEHKYRIAGINQITAQAKRRLGETKLTASQKRAILREFNAGFAYGMTKRLAGQYGVSVGTIRNVRAAAPPS